MIRHSFAIVVLLSAAVIRAEDKPADEAPAPIIKAEGEVTIDGALDEGFWAKAPVIRADYMNSKQGVLSDVPRLKVKYAWDEHYLYIGYETFDANIENKSNGKGEGPEKNQRMSCENWSPDPKEKVDVVEFFITFGDDHFFWELHHNGSNQFNDIWVNSLDPEWPIAKSSAAPFGIIFNPREFIQDDGAFTTAMAVKLKPKADGTPSTINNPADIDTGYTAEIRFPWGGIGAPMAAKPNAKKKETAWKIEGTTLRIFAACQDGDLPERYHHSSPKRKPDWFHKNTQLWNSFILSR